VTRDLAEVSPLSRRAPARIHPITGWHWLAPRSHTRTPMGLPCGALSPMGGVRAYHVPRMLLDGLGPAFSPATMSSAAVVTSLVLRVAYLLVQACQRLWLVLGDDEYSAVHMCWPYHQPNPPTALTLAVTISPRGSTITVAGEGTWSRGLHTAGLLPPHAPVGSGGRTPGQIFTPALLCAVVSDRSKRDLVSHRCPQPQSSGSTITQVATIARCGGSGSRKT
jgi:hypothetical protein